MGGIIKHFVVLTKIMQQLIFYDVISIKRTVNKMQKKISFVLKASKQTFW